MFLEIMVSWLWQLGIVVALVLIGYLLQDRRLHHFSKSSMWSKDRLLPDRLISFRERQRQPLLKRFPR